MFIKMLIQSFEHTTDLTELKDALIVFVLNVREVLKVNSRFASQLQLNICKFLHSQNIDPLHSSITKLTM